MIRKSLAISTSLSALMILTGLPSYADEIRTGDVIGGSSDGFNLIVGNTANGALEINGGTQVDVPNDFPFVTIGNNAGVSGNIIVSGDDGAGTPSTLDVNGFGFDFAAFLEVGNDGDGSLTISNGAVVNIEFGDTVPNAATNSGASTPGDLITANNGGGFTVGDNAGSNGMVVIDNAQMNVNGRYSFSDIGERAGSTGEITIRNGGGLNISGDNSILDVGFEGNGTLNVESGGSLNNLLFLNTGSRVGGTGIVNVTGGSINLTGACDNTCGDPENQIASDGQGAFLSIGALGTGTVNVSGDSQIVIDSGAALDAFPGFNLGGDADIGFGGNGMLNVDGANAQVLVNGENGFAAIGRVSGGVGVVNVTNGGRVAFDNVDGQAATFIADGENSVGELNILGGSIYDTGSLMRISLAQDGSQVNNTSGIVTLGENSRLVAGLVEVGEGGVFGGSGTLVGDVFSKGGLIRPGFSPGIFTIDGNVTGDSILFDMEFDGNSGEFDFVNITGDLLVAEIVVNLIVTGDILDIGSILNMFSVAGVINENLNVITQVAGIDSTLFDFGFNAGGGGFVNTLASIAPVPLPAALPLLLAALGGLGLVRWRRERANAA